MNYVSQLRRPGTAPARTRADARTDARANTAEDSSLYTRTTRVSTIKSYRDPLAAPSSMRSRHKRDAYGYGTRPVVSRGQYNINFTVRALSKGNTQQNMN